MNLSIVWYHWRLIGKGQNNSWLLRLESNTILWTVWYNIDELTWSKENIKVSFYKNSLSEWMALKFSTIFSLEPFHSIAQWYFTFKSPTFWPKCFPLHWSDISRFKMFNFLAKMSCDSCKLSDYPIFTQPEIEKRNIFTQKTLQFDVYN